MLDHLARIAHFAMTRDEALARHCCVRCGDEIDDDWTTVDRAEWNISALCGACFDVIAEPDGLQTSRAAEVSPSRRLGPPQLRLPDAPQAAQENGTTPPGRYPAAPGQPPRHRLESPAADRTARRVLRDAPGHNTP